MDAFQIRCFVDGERVPSWTQLDVGTGIETVIVKEQIGGGVDGVNENSEQEGEADNVSEVINLTLVDTHGSKTIFKVKKTTRLGKIFDTYALRNGVPVSTYRFSLDADRLNRDLTVKMAELSEETIITVGIEVQGGVLQLK